MIHKIIFALFLLFSACYSGDKKTGKKHSSSEKIVEERINGPANIRDTIGGKILFRLNDNARVSCTPLENNWYVVGVMMDIDTSEFGNNKVLKGRKILVNNKESGEVLRDMEVSTAMGGDVAWAVISGYTHKDNIKQETILENVLKKKINDNSDRKINSFKDIIDDFQLEKDDQFKGYTVYYNYENWIDDPSPMWRIGLVFQNDTLVAILHSRPIQINATKDYQLDRGFDCILFNDTKDKEKLVQTFNHFVNSVD
jgi:hypothetical protein